MEIFRLILLGAFFSALMAAVYCLYQAVRTDESEDKSRQAVQEALNGIYELRDEAIALEKAMVTSVRVPKNLFDELVRRLSKCELEHTENQQRDSQDQ